MENNSTPAPTKSNNLVWIVIAVIGIAFVMRSSGDDESDDSPTAEAPTLAVSAPAYEPPRPCDDAYLSTLNEKQLRIRRNEVYARKGRPFKSADLRAHFFGKPWYKPDPNFHSSRLSLADQQCVDRVQVWEDEAEHMRSLGYAN